MHLTDRIPTIPTQVRNYFLDNSPNAIFVMDLPQQVLNNTKQTKSMTEEKQKVKISVVQAASNVKAFNPNQRGGLKIEDQAASGIFEKQKAKIQMNRQFIGKLKALLRAQNLQRVKLVSHIMKCKMVEFKAQVESGNPDYKVIHSIVHEIRDLIPTSLRVNLEAHFSSQYEKVKTLLHTCIDASQWAKIETILGNFRLFERFHSNNNHSQSAGRSVEHCQAARPSTAEVPNYTLAKKVAQEKQKGVTSGYWQAIAKQDVELHMQDQVIGKLKAKVRARKFQHGKLVLLMIKYKMAELVVQVESGNPDYEVIRSIGRDIKDFIPGSSGVNLEAQFSSQYNEVKSRLFTRIDASQWALIEKELGNLRHFEKLPSNSSHIQAALHATELPPAPKPYPDIVLQKRSREEVPNDTMANKVAKLEAGKKQPEPMPQDQEIRMLKEKIRMQDQLIAKQNASLQVQFQVTEQQKVRIQMQDQIIGELKAKLGAHDMQHEQLISQFIKCKVGELKLQVESGNPDYRVIHSIGCDIKGLIPGSLGVNVEAFFSSQYEEVKSLLGTCIDASQWAKISTELGSLRFSQRFHLNKRQSQHAMMTSSGLGCTGSNMEGSCK
uniref:uncharacterized protein LOC122602267 n=1 Tax=Erigeron canadensis TaxID=72917 RepID=UPI001CB97F43|nr:uncharacterized protein LOC122602267 [Erigeron canadensis]